MKPGSVTVDLAAEQGGNVETTVPGQVITTSNGVTCVGYTDLPSRLPTQASTLYSNNVSKLLLSTGPFTGHKGAFAIDHTDGAVRGALVLEEGELRWPPPPAAAPAAPPKPKAAEKAAKAEPTAEELRAETMRSAATTAAGLTALVGLGAASPGPAFSAMLTKFGLASVCGYQVRSVFVVGFWGFEP